MRFILRMAWRDTRSARRRLAFYSLSIVLGVAALVAIGSLRDNLREGVEGQAKGLLGADLVVQSRVALTAEAETFLQGLGGRQARETVFASMAVFPSAEGRTRLVTVRALEGPFPFYGEFETDPAPAAASLRPGGRDAVIEETLLTQFGLRVGDTVRLGETEFRIAGVLKKIPGESAAVALLSPRVFIPLSELASTGLAGPGSLVRHRVYLGFDDGRDVEALVRDLRERFRELRLGFDTVEERKREFGRALSNVYGFLSLVGFIALFLGGIGIASAVSVHIRGKLPTVAVLRCLGASSRQAFAIYLVQGLGLGLAGSLLGAALGVGVQSLLPPLIRGVLPFEFETTVSWSAVAQGTGAGVAIGLLFTLLPLLAVRRVSPLAAIRSFVTQTSGADPLRFALYGLIAAAVTGFAVWQTGRIGLGVGFAVALGVGLAILGGLARAIAWAARRFLPRGLPFVVRQGVANLHRPNNRTVLLLMSLGLGTFLLMTLSLSRETLLAQVSGPAQGARPNLLFFDVQDDQKEPLSRLMAAAGAPVSESAPIVTMRLASLKGQPISEILKDPQSRIPAWTLRREYRSTFRGAVVATEQVKEGTFVGKVDGTEVVVPISMEVGLARDMGLKLGDEVEWDVQGVPIRTQVGSLREVDWRRLSPNFFVVFPEGVLEAAPKFFVVATHVGSPAESARVQQAAVAAFPNVSAIDLALVLETVDGIFSKIAYVIRFMALFTVATGVIVLAGAVLTGRFQRLREAVLLRTLGASRRQLNQILAVEYLVLGTLAALAGGGLAYAANALLAVYVFQAPVVAPPGHLVVAVLGVSAVTLLTGFLSNRGLANHPPLEVLRQE